MHAAAAPLRLSRRVLAITACKGVREYVGAQSITTRCCAHSVKSVEVDGRFHTAAVAYCLRKRFAACSTVMALVY
jgi:hypothetical protein